MISRSVYSFAIDVVTNYCKLTGLQPKFIVLQFLKPEVQNGSHWAAIGRSAGLCSFLGLRGTIGFLAFP